MLCSSDHAGQVDLSVRKRKAPDGDIILENEAKRPKDSVVTAKEL